MNMPALPRSGCAGMLFWCMLSLVLAGCSERQAEPEPVSFELNGDTITLEPGGEILDVEMRAPGGRGAFQPGEIQASTGDVVRFTAVDGHTHAIVFEPDSTAPAQAAFLEQSNQMRSPPLLGPGARWIISLEAAPAGTLRFRCLAHGERGILIVSARRP